MTSFALPSVTAVPAPCSWKWKAAVRGKPLIFPSTDCYSSSSISIGRFDVRAFFPNPSQQPILKEALKVFNLLSHLRAFDFSFFTV
ncbi:Concanavalin A-like lectin protein kinase family protein [Perilla frutescens var. hirtella]|uniref:Concanavalin A-like lectin protein kinase family protein n=1 Tax=Perilla frutescens var. hirtella TaxID=608512 RepID=A0AAD4JF02_PERFH|nr:Concanavalin A-like lectin protein kinase family protein [Perilla frutescens var. frutescens]KAH6832206.1 Concanavalin A-like lectin protein kinase family protein [Perilla frutescens var. hirtella]